jgi:hypothetical protein
VSQVPIGHPAKIKVDEFEHWIHNVYLPEKELAVLKNSNQRLLAFNPHSADI